MSALKQKPVYRDGELIGHARTWREVQKVVRSHDARAKLTHDMRRVEGPDCFEIGKRA